MKEKEEQHHIQVLSEFTNLHQNDAEALGHTIRFIQHFLFILRSFYTQKRNLSESVLSLYNIARDIRHTLEEVTTKSKLNDASVISIDKVQKSIDEILIDLDFYCIDEKGGSPNIIKRQNIENLIAMTDEKEHISQKTCGTILLLDRNPNTQTSLSFRLENEGHEVLVAKNSTEAEELVNRLEIDLLIIDEFTLHHADQALFDLCLNEKKFTIIAVIGDAGNSQLIATSFIKGAEDFIPKPVNAELLKARVHSALEKRQLFLHRIQKHYKISEVEESPKNSMNLLHNSDSTTH